MPDIAQATNTEAQSEPLERIGFQVPRQFKAAVDMAVLLRRSTLRRECTEALARHFGLASPGAEATSPGDATDGGVA